MDKKVATRLNRVATNLSKVKIGNPRRGSSVREHIEDGLLGIIEALSFDVAETFIDSIQLLKPLVLGRMSAGVEGHVWGPDRESKPGVIFISFGLGKFDLNEAVLELDIRLPNGNNLNKSWNAGSDWINKPALTNGRKFAEVLSVWISDFFTAQIE